MLANKIFHQPLAWVKPELDITVKKAKSILEALAEDLGNAKLLDELNQELYLLKGSLEILCFDGAALLIEDMQKACLALKKNKTKNAEETYEVLLEATLSLESYIDKLHKDQTDIPIALLPLLNDIRASIDEPLLSESALFLPNLSIVPKTPAIEKEKENSEECLRESAKSLRPYYQAALLSWFRNPTDQLSIQQMKLVARNLESTCHTPRNRQIWWILGGLFEALADKGLKSNVALRLLLGQADRIIRTFSNNELTYYEKTPPFNLLKNTLYYISRATSNGERVSTLKQVYQLDKVMPSEKDLSKLRAQLKGPNTETLQAIAKELKKTLTQTKAVLENFIRNTPDNTDRLLQTIIPLKHVADTLTILSLSKEKQILQEQISRLNTIIENKQRPNKEAMMEIAAALIQVDSSLQYIGTPARKPQDRSTLNQDEETSMNKDSQISFGKLPETEYRHLRSKAILEAKANIAQVKNAILAFISADCSDRNILLQVPDLLAEVKGCLQMLDNPYAADIINGLSDCINNDLILNSQSEVRLDFDMLAETLVSIDYYLEAVSEERASTEQFLNLARECLNKLGYKVQQPKRESKIPTLEAVVTHITEAPTRIKISANALSGNIRQGIAKSSENTKEETGEGNLESVVEFSPEAPDSEVAEIFIEEALEELDKMAAQLKLLQIDLSDKETLSNIHRIYHTLKGSGKIAGAIHISDFSSTIEEYLNRVLCGAISINQEGASLLNSSHELLHKLVECFQKRVAPPSAFNSVTETAIRLMSAQHQPKQESAQNQPGQEDKKIEVATAPIRKSLLPLGEIEGLLKESFAHLALISKYIDEKNENIDLSPVPGYVSDAINKLHKNALVTDVKEFIQTTDLLAKYIGNLVKKQAPINSESLDILSEFCTTTHDILLELPHRLNASEIDAESFAHVDVELPVQQNPHPAYLSDLAEQEQVEVQTPEETDVSNKAELTTPAIEDVKPEQQSPTEEQAKTVEPLLETELEEDLDLINIFIEEAEELIAKGQDIINDNDLSQFDANVLVATQRLLHTMKGSARMAGASSVGNIAHLFESLTEAVANRQIDYPQNYPQFFQDVLDAINDMIDDIKSGDDVRLHEELYDSISTLLTPQELIEEAIEESAEETVLENSEQEPAAELISESVISKADEAIEITDTSELSDEIDVSIEIDRIEQTTEAALVEDDTAEHEAEVFLVEENTTEHPTEAVLVEEDTTEQKTETAITEDNIELISLPEINETLESEKQEIAEVNPELEPDHQENSIPEPEMSTPTPEVSETNTVIKLETTQTKGESLKINSSLIDSIVDQANTEGSINNRLEDHVATIKTNLLELDKAISRALSQMRDLQFNTSRNQDLAPESSITNELNLSQFTESQKIALRMMESIGDIENLHSVITKTTLETDNLIQQQKKAHAEMYETLLSTRLVNFSVQTQRIQRILRQTCQSLNKKAELHMEGTEGSIDRVLLESIMGPLEHIIRNAVAHGIESPETRVALNKDSSGHISIRFRKEESQHVIEIQDDGAGIHPEVIKLKAIEKGIITDSTELSEEQVLQLIFEPGFSTSDNVDQISGRGVGMNVVLSEIEALGGSVAIQSKINEGTTFTIQLPFTVSRNKTLLVSANKSTYAIPTNAVVQTIPISQSKLEALYTESNPNYEFEEQDYPLWYIESLLNKKATTLPDKYQNAYLLILRYKHRRLALQVDQINETRDSVLKSTSPQLAGIKGLAGTTILSDGKVVLILDIPSLFNLAEERSNTPTQIVYPKAENTDDKQISALIVDDSITVRKVSERFLNRNNITTESARDGVEALEILQDYKPDVILLDIEMPNMDGLELARRVKSDAKLGHIPIIMITSRTGQTHRQAASEIGVEVFLGKPYQESELLGYIQALTGKRLRHA